MKSDALTVLTLDEADRWDEIVKSFQNYDVYYLQGYVKAFEIHGDGQPLLFYYEDENVRGINVVMKRDVAQDTRFEEKIMENTYFDFSTPYGYGGWLVEGSTDNIKLFDAYENWCRENNIVSEFVRYHPVIENHAYSESFCDVIPLGETVSMDLSSKEVIWNNLTSKNRNMIRKAKKNGIKIYHGNFPEIYETFRGIYNATMDKDNADSYYYFDSSFYQSIINELPNNTQVFYAEFDGKVIAASIMIAANGRMNYYLSGSVWEYRNLAPTNLLLYEAALWGCENGYKTFHLGGGRGSQEDSLYQFKKGFNRRSSCQFFTGRKIYLKDTYQELVGMKESISKKSNFFPEYRA